MRNTTIQFCEKKKIFFGVSLAILAIGLVFNLVFGTQLDIQFKGGALIKYSYNGAVNQDEIAKIVKGVAAKDVSVRVHEAAGGERANTVSISFAGEESISVEQQKAIAEKLDETYESANFQVVESSSINPTMGRSFFLKCIIAVLIAAVLLVVYIAFRFKKIGGMSAGLMSIVALLHDLLIVYFTFIIFRIPLNDSFIAVVLTILGYSLNNTIIIYDRIRENRRLMGPKATYEELVDRSINQTLSRSVYTSLSTFVVIAAVYVVAAVFGLTTVTTFALPMMVGIVAGCYSSVCIAGPLYVVWQQHKDKRAAAAEGASAK